MSDKIEAPFFRTQLEEGTALAARSSILELTPKFSNAHDPPRAYLAVFNAGTLAKPGNAPPRKAERVAVQIRFHDGYLRAVNPAMVLTVLHPLDLWHPNIAGFAICIGRLLPGTPLVDILYQLYEVITYRKWSANDGLNPAACQWARNHQDAFPTDPRSLKRRTLSLQATTNKDEQKPN